jgi:CheY-like chemotaxis protein
MVKIACDRPALVLTDLGMPGEDGYALVKQLRALPAERGGGTPAIALTGFAGDGLRVRSLEAGFQEHFTKPVEPAVLLARIGKLARRD